MKEVFTKKLLIKYNPQNCSATLLPNPKTKKYGTDRIAYKAAQLAIVRFIQIRKKKTGIVVTAPAISVKFWLMV